MTAVHPITLREFADIQVEVHAGGQPLYPYLFGVE